MSATPAEATGGPGAHRPTASIVIPTRARPGYLEVTLASVAAQAAEAGAEVVVVQDGADAGTEAVARRHGARLATLPEPRGLNAARNQGVQAARAEVIVFVDDDIRAQPGWLAALLEGIGRAPEVDVFGGPIRAELEGGPRSCGREPPPITTLDCGVADRDVDAVWGANMAIRRSALERVGPFDEALAGRGDEEEWERRYGQAGGRIRYVAGAAVVHRRSRRDARLAPLARAAYALGRTARRNDVRKRAAPSAVWELRVLAGCLWHTLRRRCGYGIVMAAHASGRLRELFAERRRPRSADAPAASGPPDFLSGTAGAVFGVRATTRALAADLTADAMAVGSGRRQRLRRAAERGPRRRVLALAVERADAPNLLAAAVAELERSRHQLDFAVTAVGDRGKFENLNALLREHPVHGYDWLLLLDDDVTLPRGFLDAFVFLAERFDLRLAQPAHRRRSHAAWEVTRQRPRSLVRETAFVEIGPVVAFQATTFATFLPFPALRYGWGLDAHWSAVARDRGWKMGVVDATPVRHGLRLVASGYDSAEAVAEARQFLAERPYTTAAEARRTLAEHRSWR